MELLNWKLGPPPHVGWWNASFVQNRNAWRWWDGENWSKVVYSQSPMQMISNAIKRIEENQSRIKWNDSYPKNARVARINPNK